MLESTPFAIIAKGTAGATHFSAAAAHMTMSLPLALWFMSVLVMLGLGIWGVLTSLSSATRDENCKQNNAEATQTADNEQST